MDKGGEVRPELEQAVVPQVRGQSGEAGAVHPGLQPGQLRQKAGLVGGDEAPVLTNLQTRLIKTGGRLAEHARRLVFQLAEVLVAGKCWPGY
jgi:hypothetical protein